MRRDTVAKKTDTKPKVEAIQRNKKNKMKSIGGVENNQK